MVLSDKRQDLLVFFAFLLEGQACCHSNLISESVVVIRVSGYLRSISFALNVRFWS